MGERFDPVKFINDLRNGKHVKCPKCNEGHIVPVGDPKTTHGFYCDKCNIRVDID